MGMGSSIRYIFGGMLIGPGCLGLVTELVEMETLASLGIAFLLFSLGIEFSFSELQKGERQDCQNRHWNRSFSAFCIDENAILLSICGHSSFFCFPPSAFFGLQRSAWRCLAG